MNTTETPTFRSDDLHTLMDLVAEKVGYHSQNEEMVNYTAYLENLKERLTALWTEVLPGQEAVFTVREQEEEGR